MQINSRKLELVGEQEPRLKFLPSQFDPVLSADRADDMVGVAEVAGLFLDPWQVIGAEALTLTRSDGRWSAFEAFVAANRQQGKGTIIEARQLAGLFVWGESLQVYTAHEFKTAQEMFLRIRQLIESTPTLDRMVQRIRTADGEEAIETKSGCRLKFMARSGSSGRGFTAPTLYLDEAMKLKQRMLASLMPTMSALSLTGNPQLMYFSSAGEADSEVQEGVRARAIEAKSSRLVYVEWSVPRWDELPAGDRDRWPSPVEYRADPEVHRRANPGYNIRLDPDFVMTEHDALAAVNPEEFDRERLGIWAKLGAGGAIPMAQWRDLLGDPDENEFVDADGRVLPGEHRVAFAVDIPKSRDSASIVMAGDLGDGRISVVVIDRDEGTDWIADRLQGLVDRWNPVAVVLDAMAQGSSLDAELRRRRVRALKLNYKQYREACGAFYDAVMQSRLRHSGQSELNVAVESATRKDTDSGLWKWARGGDGDISSLVAATLAVHGLVSKPVRSGAKVVFG